MVYHLKIPSFTICLQLKENIPSLLLPIQKPLEHLKISPFTIYLHSNSTRISSEAVLKNSRFCHCKIMKTLDFIEFFGCSSALCEKRFSQFSRNLLATFLHFLAISEAFRTHFPKGSGTIRDNLITYGGISKRS